MKGYPRTAFSDIARLSCPPAMGTTVNDGAQNQSPHDNAQQFLLYWTWPQGIQGTA